MGRKSNGLTERLYVRLTPLEKKAVQRAAEVSGCTASQFIRETVFCHPQEITTRKEALEKYSKSLVALRGELLRQGNNLNQIAYMLNRLKDRAGADDVATVTKILSEIGKENAETRKSIDKTLRKVSDAVS